MPENSRRERKAESDNWWDRQHSLVLRQSPRWAQALTLFLILLGSGAIAGSIAIKIDEVITVTGKLTPSGGKINVMTPAGGLIKNIYVKEGDTVKKGMKLVQFDTRRAEEEIRNVNKQIKEIERTHISGLRSMKGKKSSVLNSLRTNKSILSRMKDLEVVGAVEKTSLLRQTDQVFQLQKEYEEVTEQEIQIKSNYARNLSELRTRLNNSNLQKQYETVYATKDGVIFDLKATENGVLAGGQSLMMIIPQTNLKASVDITNKNIGFIRAGQPAQVRVDAFNFTQFGIIEGRIESIGADVIEPKVGEDTYKFPVTISLKKNYLETKDIKIPVKSGMSITANIKLREKRLISVVNDLLNDNYDALQRLRQ